MEQAPSRPNGLKQFYARLEDSFYAFAEFLEAKGVPAIRFFVEPLENAGMPSFPIAALLLIALVAGGLFLALGGAPQGGLTVRVYADNAALEGAQVTVYAGDVVVSQGETNSKGEAFFPDLKGNEYTVKAVKQGYALRTQAVDLRERSSIRLDLSKGGEIILPSATPTPDPWAFQDAHDEDSYGKLRVNVKDAATGDAVSATVRVFNAKSSVMMAELESAASNGGTVSMEGVQIDTQVFLTVSSDGYLAYEGSQNPTVVKAGVTTITVELTEAITLEDIQNASNNSYINYSQVNAGYSTITVFKEDEEPLKYADVAVYQLSDGIAVLIEEDDTPSNGSVTFLLNNSNEYFAVASKGGYFDAYTELFEAGEDSNLTLVHADENSIASLLVTIESEYEEVVEDALVQPFALTSFGYYYALAPSQETNDEGQTEFDELLRSNVMVIVNASAFGGAGSTATSLQEAENNATIMLYWEDATITARALDLVTNASVGATFTAYYDGVELDSCVTVTGGSCNLTVKPRKPINITVEANGYEPFETVENLEPLEFINAYYYIYPTDALDGSELIFQKAVSTTPLHYGEEVESLKLGHTYSLYYSFYSEDADLAGAYSSLGNFVGANEDARFTGRYPPAAIEWAGDSLSCSPELFEEDGDYAWLDLAFAANVPNLLVFNVTIDEDAELNEETHSANLTAFYRSYLKQGEAWLRNPLDEALGTSADDPLESGCYSPMYNETFLVMSPKTTCDNGVCTTFEYAQGSDSLYGAGFNADSMQGIAPEDDEFEALEMHYYFEFYKNAGDSITIAFNSEAEHTELLSISIPNADCTGSELVELDNNYFSLDLSHVKACSNYHDYDPAVYPENWGFGGVIYARPLAEVEQTPTALQLTTAKEDSVHNSWYAIGQGEQIETEYATLSFNDFSQTAYPSEDETVENQDLPRVISVSDCTDNEIALGECHHGLLSFEFQVEIERGRDSNTISLSTSETKLQLVSVQYTLPGDSTQRIAQITGSQAVINAGALEQGDEIEGKAYAKPLLEQGYSTYTSVTLLHSTVDEFGTHEVLEEQNVMVAANASIPESGWQGWFQEGENNCQGQIIVTFDPALLEDQHLYLQGGCTDLGMRITPLFPADAIPTTVQANGQALLAKLAVAPEGYYDEDAAGCFESCSRDPDTNEVGSCTSGYGKALAEEGYWALRYNTELASCPDSYRLVGNSLSNADIKFYVWPTGQDETTSGLNVTFHVNSYTTASSIYIYPILTSYEQVGDNDYGVFGPQLWAIVNHKQIGSRTIVLCDIEKGDENDCIGLGGDYWFEFDGPGIQTFTFTPETDRRFTALEKLSNTHVIFDSELSWEEANAAGLLTNVSEYALAVQAVSSDDLQSMLAGCPEENPYCIQLEEYLDEIMATMTEVTRGNVAYEPEAALHLVEKARLLANYSMFWRSDSQAMYCQDYSGLNYFTEEEDDYLECSPGTWDAADDECCRATVDDWRNITVVYEFEETACAYCNNSYNPDCDDESEGHLSEYFGCTYNPDLSCGQDTTTTPQCYGCDQRCMHLGDGEGQAIIEFGSWFAAGDDAMRKCAGPLHNYPMESISTSQIAEECTIEIGDEIKLKECGIKVGLHAYFATPYCFQDTNGDGLLNANEESGDFADKEAGVYSCSSGELIAVKDYDASKKTTITASFLDDYCQQESGYCAVLRDEDSGKPYCFEDSNGDGVYNWDSEEIIGTAYSGGMLHQGQYWCSSGYIAVSEACGVPCTSWCYSPPEYANCELSCNEDGTNLSITGSYEDQTGWINQGDLTSVTFGLDPQGDAEEFEKNKLWPGRFYGLTEFNYNFPINTFGFESDNLAESVFYNQYVSFNSQDVDYGDCGYSSQNAYSYQAIFGVSVKNVREIGTGQDLWSGAAAPLSLDQDDYMGYPCNKPDWSIEYLCAPLWADFQPLGAPGFGACINSALQYEDSDKTGEPLSALLAGGRVKSGGISGKDYWISPGGYTFRLVDAHKVSQVGPDDWRAEFEWWHPDGAYGGTEIKVWEGNWGGWIVGGILTIAGAVFIAVPGLNVLGFTMMGAGIAMIGAFEIFQSSHMGSQAATMQMQFLTEWDTFSCSKASTIISEGDVKVKGCRGANNHYNVYEK